MTLYDLLMGPCPKKCHLTLHLLMISQQCHIAISYRRTTWSCDYLWTSGTLVTKFTVNSSSIMIKKKSANHSNQVSASKGGISKMQTRLQHLRVVCWSPGSCPYVPVVTILPYFPAVLITPLTLPPKDQVRSEGLPLGTHCTLIMEWG